MKNQSEFESRTLTVRCAAFGQVASHRIVIDADDTIRVYDDVAGYYTRCHSLSKSACRRIRKLAK